MNFSQNYATSRSQSSNYEEDVSSDASGVRGRNEEDVWLRNQKINVLTKNNFVGEQIVQDVSIMSIVTMEQSLFSFMTLEDLHKKRTS